MKTAILFLIGFIEFSSSLTQSRSINDLKNYPIPVPLRPYPVTTDNSYRSDNAWGEIRTASEGPDHFRIEITKEDGSREGIALHKTADGKVQRQYYEAGSFGYRVKRSNRFVESAPKRITQSIQPPSNENYEQQFLNDEENTIIVTSPDPHFNVGKFAAGSVRGAAFSYTPPENKPKQNPLLSISTMHDNRRVDEKLTGGSQIPTILPPGSPALNPETFTYYQDILTAVRPGSNFLNEFFSNQPFANQVSVSRPQTISLAGASGQSEAVSSGTALAGPGSTAIAAPESVSIAGPGGYAFSTSTGISSVNTNFDNDGSSSSPSTSSSNSQDSGPIVIEESKHPNHRIPRPRPPFNIRPRPVPSHVTREEYISKFTNPISPPNNFNNFFSNNIFGHKHNPFSRQSPDAELLGQFNPWALLSNAIVSGRGNPTPYTGQDRNNVVYNNGRTVISPADSNVAVFYHHTPSPFLNSFTFQKHGSPSFYYFQH